MPTAATMTGPDFIGIGLQKAGTRWLYNQLENHPDFWMPPIKELHFFDRPFPHPSMVAKGDKRGKRKRHEQSQEFYELIRELPQSATHDFDTYGRLFSFAAGRLTGDITPAYSRLDAVAIKAIAEHLPQVKAVLMLRDPISRLWSNLNDAAGRDKVDPAAVTDAGVLSRTLKEARYGELSYPSRIHQRWAAYFPETRLRWFFLDDVIAEPEATRTRILRYLGGDPLKKSGDLSLSHNPKSGRPRAEMDGAIRDCLVREFEDELRACARLFGGPAQAWLAKYGIE